MSDVAAPSVAHEPQPSEAPLRYADDLGGVPQRVDAPDTLLIIGWGAPQALADRWAMLPAPPRRILVVDPWVGPGGSASALPDDWPGHDQIKVWPASRDADATVQIFNFPGLRSITAPTGALLGILPGLRVQKTASVEMVSPDTLASYLGGPGGHDEVWIDLPGAEMVVLTALASAGWLDGHTTRLLMRCGSEPWFEGSASVAQVIAQVETRFMRLTGIDQRDPDWPDLCFVDDPGARTTALKAQIAALQVENNALEVERAEAVAVRDGAALEHAELSALAKRQDAEMVALKAKIAALTDDKAKLEAVRERLERQYAEQGTAVDQATSRIATLEAESERHAKDTAAAIAAKEKAEAEAAEQAGTNATMTEAMHRLRAEKAALDERLMQVEAALETARLDLGLALDGQKALRAEVETLTERYAALHDERDDLSRLIAQLTPRLREAADHLSHIHLDTVEGGEPRAEAIADGDSKRKKAKSKSSAKASASGGKRTR